MLARGNISEIALVGSTHVFGWENFGELNKCSIRY